MSPRVEHLAERVTLFCSDCREALELLGTVDLVITDPPYSSGARTDSERQVRGAMLRSMEDADWYSHDAMTTWGFSWFVRSVFGALREKLPQGAHAYVFIDWRQSPNLLGLMESCGYRVNHNLVWNKGHFGMGSCWRNQHENIVFASNGMPTGMLDRGMGSVITCPPVSPSARQHASEKPVDLLVTMIDAVPGEHVFDPFMGGGSVGVAAVRCGRAFSGCEINPKHFDTACRRIEDELRRPRMVVHKPIPVIQEALI